jgi:hypothetical protein
MNPRPLLAYFARPFPSRQGFSAYRMPGPAFHLSIVLLALVVGLPLCIPANDLETAPLLAVWLLVGLYFGRDLAVFAHYNSLLVIAWVIGLIVVFAAPDWVESAFQALSAFSREHYPEGAIGATALLAAAFAGWVRWMSADLSA